MRYRIPVVLALALLAACSSTVADSSKVGTLDFYDWLRIRREEYAAALDQGREANFQQLSIANKLKFEVDLRYDSIVERANNERDPERRELALSALGFSGRPEAVAHLEKGLADPLPYVRGTAAAAIGILNPPQPGLGKIAALLVDSDEYVRKAALFAIKLLVKPDRSLPDGALNRITGLAKEDANFEVRNEAVLALGRIRATSSIDDLARYCLNDESALVRRNAAWALYAYGPEAASAVPFLIERLRDGETGVVEVAHWALKNITRRMDSDRQYSSWLDWHNEQSKVLEYSCPTHPDIKSASPGACPTCGAPLLARAIPGVILEYVCPEHTKESFLKPGKCTTCQKDLVPRKKDSLK